MNMNQDGRDVFPFNARAKMGFETRDELFGIFVTKKELQDRWMRFDAMPYLSEPSVQYLLRRWGPFTKSEEIIQSFHRIVLLQFLAEFLDFDVPEPFMLLAKDQVYNAFDVARELSRIATDRFGKSSVKRKPISVYTAWLRKRRLSEKILGTDDDDETRQSKTARKSESPQEASASASASASATSASASASASSGADGQPRITQQNGSTPSVNCAQPTADEGSSSVLQSHFHVLFKVPMTEWYKEYLNKGEPERYRKLLEDARSQSKDADNDDSFKNMCQDNSIICDRGQLQARFVNDYPTMLPEQPQSTYLMVSAIHVAFCEVAHVLSTTSVDWKSEREREPDAYERKMEACIQFVNAFSNAFDHLHLDCVKCQREWQEEMIENFIPRLKSFRDDNNQYPFFQAADGSQRCLQWKDDDGELFFIPSKNNVHEPVLNLLHKHKYLLEQLGESKGENENYDFTERLETVLLKGSKMFVQTGILQLLNPEFMCFNIMEARTATCLNNDHAEAGSQGGSWLEGGAVDSPEQEKYILADLNAISLDGIKWLKRNTRTSDPSQVATLANKFLKYKPGWKTNNRRPRIDPESVPKATAQVAALRYVCSLVAIQLVHPEELIGHVTVRMPAIREFVLTWYHFVSELHGELYDPRHSFFARKKMPPPCTFENYRHIWNIWNSGSFVIQRHWLLKHFASFDGFVDGEKESFSVVFEKLVLHANIREDMALQARQEAAAAADDDGGALPGAADDDDDKSHNPICTGGVGGTGGLPGGTGTAITQPHTLDANLQVLSEGYIGAAFSVAAAMQGQNIEWERQHLPAGQQATMQAISTTDNVSRGDRIRAIKLAYDSSHSSTQVYIVQAINLFVTMNQLQNPFPAPAAPAASLADPLASPADPAAASS